ncbi:MAG: radical SAM protein, partial [Trichlorobacter sp.]|nr:radical SAM protein [Trichlorobacter sp.]
MFSRLYLHIPWCVSKCNYCAFFSRPIPTEADLEETVQLLQTEMELSAKQFTVSKPLDSIYFGGGTPSLLTPVQVGRLLSHSKSLWEHSADMEITLEANPGTVSSDKLAGYLDVGVNRLSLGVQSFDDYQLSVLGRQHRSQQAEQAVLWARDAGFDAVGIDLICGLPDQTLADWQQQLSRAVEA